MVLPKSDSIRCHTSLLNSLPCKAFHLGLGRMYEVEEHGLQQVERLSKVFHWTLLCGYRERAFVPSHDGTMSRNITSLFPSPSFLSVTRIWPILQRSFFKRLVRVIGFPDC